MKKKSKHIKNRNPKSESAMEKMSKVVEVIIFVKKVVELEELRKLILVY